MRDGFLEEERRFNRVNAVIDRRDFLCGERAIPERDALCCSGCSALVPLGERHSRFLVLLLIFISLTSASSLADEDKEEFLLGRYEAVIPDEGKGRGELSRHPSDDLRFRWSNDAGESWELTLDIKQGFLRAEKGQSDIQLQFAGREG